MEYKKIKPKKLYEEVAETIYEMIRTGQLKPGQKLDSVQQLSENFQVGRSAIREALTSLRALGLVELRHGEGTFIKEFDNEQIMFPLSTAILLNKEDIDHLLEIRKIIEVGSAATAARKRTVEHLKKMEKALDEMQLSDGNEELGEEADWLFHISVAEASQNPLLVSLMNNVSALIVETMRETRKVWLFSKQTTVEKLYGEHAAIYQAIVDQDVERAMQSMQIHIENVEEILQRYYLQQAAPIQ
ncbi:MAG: FadR/GntR family transcriptional regulator [Bacillota bacterium]|nr:FadR/GntR family transcriptional regulator [Bacillota bacterium]